MINSVVWLMWLVAVLIFILSTRNPIYLFMVLSGLIILGYQLINDRIPSSWIRSNLRFITTMIILSTLINGLFSHVGNTVLFTIPQRWPLIGGNITLESLTYGAINGLVIGALYLLFNVINQAISTKQITRLIPRAFHPIAMMVTITLTFFPSIQQRAREIKEAQIIRGNPMKKVSDWLPIFLPLLVTSLENAIQLAESMSARGFHRRVDMRTPLNLISLILGAFFVFSGWILQLYHYPIFVPVIFYLLGGSSVMLTLIMVGKQTKITRYQHERWQLRDFAMIIMIGFFILCFVLFALLGHLPSLGYSPYPGLSVPDFQILGLVFSLLPLLPVVFISYD